MCPPPLSKNRQPDGHRLAEPTEAGFFGAGAQSATDSSAPDRYSTYLLDFPPDFPVFWGLAWCFAPAERFALPVCTTVVLLPPVAFDAAPNAAPAAAPFATGWLLCCSSAGGGGGGGGCSAGGGCSVGGGVCDKAGGAIAVMTASAATGSTSCFKGFIRPPIRLLCSGRECVRRGHYPTHWSGCFLLS